MEQRPVVPGIAICCAALLVLIAPNARALDPHQPTASFLRTDFTVENGMSIVGDILQTRDGFLWAAFPGKLTRFDGRHFVTVDLVGDPAKQVSVRSLAEGPDGDLWVAVDDDLGVFRIPRASLNQSGTMPSKIYHAGAPGRDWAVWSLRFTDDGVLWAGTKKGLYRFDGNGFTLVIPALTISHLEKMPNGHLLIISSDGWREFDGAKVLPETPPTDQLPAKQVFDVYPDREGRLWFCTDKGLFRVTGSKMERLPLPRSYPHSGAFRAYQDREGTIWAVMDAGLFRVNGNELEPLAVDIKPSLLYSDRDGNLWVATNGNGILRFKNRMVHMFTTADGLPNNVVMAVMTAHDGKLWAANNCGGLSWFDGQRFHTYSEKDGLTNSCVYALAENANHDIWLGGGGGGLYRFHEGRFDRYTTADGLANNSLNCILAARDGSIWVGTYFGLNRLRDGRFRIYKTKDGLSHNVVNAIYEDRQGRIWAGTANGLDRLEGDRFVHVISSPKLRFLAIAGEDGDGGIYLQSDLGTGRMENDRLVGITDVQGALMVRYQQDLWFAGNGIFRAPAASFRHWKSDPEEPLDRVAYTRADGLASPDSYGSPRLTTTPDGKLWVATTAGVAMIDLAHLPSAEAKPAIYIGEITVDRTTRPPGKELVLAPGIHHVEVSFDSIELTSPERTHLQYKLDGVDKGWTEAGETHSAGYSSLPVGTFKLHIRASNRDGIWDRAGIVYNITQQPFFYQTRSFEVAAAMIGGMLLVGFYRLRLRQATARLNARLEDRLAERERIARELHDTLLQGFQGLTLHFQAAMKQIPTGLPARDTMNKALQYADHVLKEGRERVRDLRAEGATESDLAQELTSFGERMRNGDVAFEVTVTGDPRPLHPVVGGEIQQIAQEALANAFRHSGASEIAVEISYASGSLGVRIRDNGCGIDQTTLESGRRGHWGLSGMRERSEKIGAQMNISSITGSGTEIDLSIPAKVSYAELAKAKKPGG